MRYARHTVSKPETCVLPQSLGNRTLLQTLRARIASPNLRCLVEGAGRAYLDQFVWQWLSKP